jgi:hypothetical protein
VSDHVIVDEDGYPYSVNVNNAGDVIRTGFGGFEDFVMLGHLASVPSDIIIINQV